MKRFLIVPMLLASLVLTPLASASVGNSTVDTYQRGQLSYSFWLKQPEAVELVADAFNLTEDEVYAEFQSGTTLRGMVEEYDMSREDYRSLVLQLKAKHREWIRVHVL